jgi:hypothetical protein
MAIKKKQYPITILSFIAATFFVNAQTSTNLSYISSKMFPWGNVNIAKTTEGVHLRFALHSDMSLRIPDSNSTISQLPNHTCFVQVPPGVIISSQVKRYSSHRISDTKLNKSTILAFSKHEMSTSTSLVQLQGYHWFRGKRIAKINVYPYINNEKGIEAIDTLEAILLYKQLPMSINSSSKSFEDKHFSAIYNSLILNSDDASTVSTEPLQWNDSTGTWLPKNNPYYSERRYLSDFLLEINITSP